MSKAINMMLLAESRRKGEKMEYDERPWPRESRRAAWEYPPYGRNSGRVQIGYETERYDREEPYRPRRMGEYRENGKIGYGNGRYEREMHYPPYKEPEPRYGEEEYRRPRRMMAPDMNWAGYRGEDEYERRRRERHMNEPEEYKEEEDDEEQEGELRPFTMKEAEEWVKGMENEDKNRPRGGKWTSTEVKSLAQKMGMSTEGEEFAEFYAVMNALYSDYGEVNKKYGINSADYYAEAAKAFINDRDAMPQKVARYYKYIVK